LNDNEIDTSITNRIFWLMIKKKEIIGFAGLKYDINNPLFKCIIEYFWITPSQRKKLNIVFVRLIRFLKTFLCEYNVKYFIIDVKTNDNFQYLSTFVKKLTCREPYKEIKGSSYFLVNIEDIKI